MARKRSASGRRYGPKAGDKVRRAVHEMKEGTLKSGGSGKKVTSRKQAIAIGLSEARREGAKVPAPSSKSRSSTSKSSKSKSSKSPSSNSTSRSGRAGTGRAGRNTKHETESSASA